MTATAQPCRDNFEVIAPPEGSVRRPEGLPLDVQAIWDDYAPVAEEMGTLKPADAMAFAQWCVMSAHLQAAWASEDPTPAPASYIQQWRTLGEMFGLCGARSRIVRKGNEKPAGNPFSRNGRRPRAAG